MILEKSVATPGGRIEIWVPVVDRETVEAIVALFDEPVPLRVVESGSFSVRRRGSVACVRDQADSG